MLLALAVSTKIVQHLKIRSRTKNTMTRRTVFVMDAGSYIEKKNQHTILGVRNKGIEEFYSIFY